MKLSTFTGLIEAMTTALLGLVGEKVRTDHVPVYVRVYDDSGEYSLAKIETVRTSKVLSRQGFYAESDGGEHAIILETER